MRGLAELSNPYSCTVLTIGNFDGVHLGHRKLISQLVDKSREFGIPSVLMSFFPHPSKILRPDKSSPRLFSTEDLEAELRALHVNVLIIEPFNYELSQLSAEEFLTRRIIPALNPREIVIGYDFAFGRERGGSAPALRELGKKFKFALTQLDPVLDKGEIVSSSLIRNSLACGDVVRVSELLQRLFYVSGQVEKGDGRGESLGFPTANLKIDGELIPAEGVYMTYFHAEGDTFPSVTNIGRKPTFHSEHDITVETHVLGQHKNFYAKRARVEFLKRVRSELKFSSARELIVQISHDVNEAKKYFGL